MRALHERIAGFSVIQAVARVFGLRNDGVERGAIEGRVHLVRDLREPPIEDRERYGVYQGASPSYCAPSASITSVPSNPFSPLKLNMRPANGTLLPCAASDA